MRVRVTMRMRVGVKVGERMREGVRVRLGATAKVKVGHAKLAKWN